VKSDKGHVAPMAGTGFETMATGEQRLAVKGRIEHKGPKILSPEAGQRRAGTWVYPGANVREGLNSPSFARLKVPKTALARLGPPSPTSIFK